MPAERLQKILASQGIASRRKAEELIRAGRVAVNGEVVTRMGVQVDPTRDLVHVDGNPLISGKPPRPIYLLIFKPPGVLSTTSDDRGRRTVLDLVPQHRDKRLFMAGRLDYHSDGLMLLTNDGEMVFGLTHPTQGVPKTYHAKVRGVPTEARLERLRRGIRLEDGPTQPAVVEVLGKARVNTWLEVIITEGRNRQVRRMLKAVGHPVQRLTRVGFAGLTTEGMGHGDARELTRLEVAALKEVADIPEQRSARSSRRRKQRVAPKSRPQ